MGGMGKEGATAGTVQKNLAVGSPRDYLTISVGFGLFRAWTICCLGL